MFSLVSYSDVLSAFQKNGYAFYPLGEVIPEEVPKAVLLRHDIDYNLLAAVRVAEANHALGVKACFCLQIRNVLYNLLEQDNIDNIHRIIELGHTIGLHFSLPKAVADSPAEELAEIVDAMVQHDMQLLASMLDVPVQPVMSWHNPSVLGAKHASLVSRPIAGLINPYALVADGLAYASDSNHRFTIEEWLDKAINSPERIHLLFHPFQWVYDSSTMEQVLAGAWRDHIRLAESEFLTNHYYRRYFPNGLPDTGLNAWVTPLIHAGNSCD